MCSSIMHRDLRVAKVHRHGQMRIAVGCRLRQRKLHEVPASWSEDSVRKACSVHSDNHARLPEDGNCLMHRRRRVVRKDNQRRCQPASSRTLSADKVVNACYQRSFVSYSPILCFGSLDVDNRSGWSGARRSGEEERPKKVQCKARGKVACVLPWVVVSAAPVDEV